MPDRAPRLHRLEIAAAPAAWAAAGFAVADATSRIGDVALRLGGGDGGIRAWTLAGGPGPDALDGLPTRWTDADAEAPSPHPNGATRLDHVVLVTDALERTLPALEAVGLAVRRIRPAGAGRRQAFLWLGARQLLLEVVETPDAAPGRARLWGLTFVVEDLAALADRLGPALAPPRPAVQPGRRIATVRREAGLGVAVAAMTPHRGRAP